MPNISDIHNIRTDAPETRDMLKELTMSILDGPPASKEDKNSRYNAGIAYLLIRRTISGETAHYYLERHGLPKSTVHNWKADMDGGLVSFVNGRFVCAPALRKPYVTEARRAFEAIVPYIDEYVETIGVIHPSTVQRMMYAKKENDALEDDQLLLEAILLARNPNAPWNTLALLKTVERLLKKHGMKKSPVEQTKAPPLSLLVKPALHYQREALRMIASSGECRIINCDQTSINLFLGPCHGFYTPQKQNKAQVTVDPRVTVTVILSVCDDGTMLTPFIIGKDKVKSIKAYDPRGIVRILDESVADVTGGGVPVRKIVKFDAAELKVDDITPQVFPELPSSDRRSTRTSCSP